MGKKVTEMKCTLATPKTLVKGAICKPKGHSRQRKYQFESRKRTIVLEVRVSEGKQLKNSSVEVRVNKMFYKPVAST